MPNRRHILACAAAGWAPALLHATPAPLSAWLASQPWQNGVHERLAAAQVPGLALVAIDGGSIVHQAGFGWADLAARRPMSPDTLSMTASVTKTFTGTAVMQLREQGRLEPDTPVDALLPFAVRHPGFAGRPVTIHQLLTHTAAIADGPAYEASYACGDPTTQLHDWLRAAFTGGGGFHPWAPGERHAYSNVGFGLLGLVVERLSGMPFERYCRQAILAPLGMARSRFLLAGLERADHATPYEAVPAGRVPGAALREAGWVPGPAPAEASQVPHCLYSFATVSDGLLRSSAVELARFAMAWLHGGELEGRRILGAGSVAEMLREQAVPQPAGYRQGLVWRGLGAGVWAHMGRDPGVAAALQIRPADGRGVVLLANGSRARPLVGQLAAEIMAHPA